MNKIFKVIWSKSKQCYIVVSEIAKNKTGKKKIVVASILAALAMAGNMQSVDATIPEGNATGNDAFAIGPQSNVNGAFGFAIGNNAKFNSGTLGFAIGVNSEATSNQSIAIGYQSKAAGRNIGGGGDPALAVGAGAKATAGGATAIGMVANASNTFATAIGKSAAASGDSSIAIGQNTTATQEKAIAIGDGSQSTNRGSTALGRSSEATGASATALGSLAVANSTSATAVGMQSKATQADTVAIGSSATAAALNSIAMGKNATITAPTSGTTLGGQDSIAVGTRSSANQHSSVSIGLEAKSDGVRSIAIGPKASATDEDTIAIGSGGIGADKNNQAAGANGSSFNTSVAGLAVTNLYYGAKSTGKQSIAIGYTANAKESGIAFGNNAVSDGGGGTAMGKSVLSRNGGVVVGQSSYATGKNSVSYGNTAQASGETSIAVGYSTTAAGQNAVAVGYSISAAGKNSVSIGSTNQAKNEGSIAIGRNNNANQNNTVVIGRDSNALGNQSIAMGANATSKGTNDVAIGNEVTADGDNSVAIGRSATTKSTASLAIGSYGTKGTSATGAFSIAMGRDVTASAESAIAIGKDAISDKKNAVAIGSGADTSTAATAQSSTNIAGKSYSWSKGVLSGADLAGMQVSVGKSGAERQIKNVAAGEVSANSTDAINGSQLYAVASGLAKDLKVPYVSINSTASGTGSNVDNDGAKGSNSIAIGPSSTVTRQNGIAIGSGAQSLSEDSVVIGRDAKAETKTGAGLTTTSRAIVIGSNSRVAADVTQGVAIGSGLSPDEGAVVTGDQSIAIGGNVKVDGHSAIAIGGDDARKAANQLVSYTNKNDAEVTGTLQTAISDLTGYNLNDYKGTTASHAGVAYGASALAGNAGVAIGTAADSMTRKNDKGQVVNNKPVTNAVAIGTGARANFDNSVAIGGGSNTDHYATKQVNAIIDGVEVKWSGGENISPGDVVSFGAKGFERQLKNVAPGEVSQTSTDAINGSQIYSLARKITNIMNGGAGSLVNVNATGEPLTKVVTGTGANKQEKYYLTADVKDDGTLKPGAVAQTPKSLALVNVDEPNVNQQTKTPRTLGNVANGVNDNDAVNVSQLKASTVKYFSVNSTDSGNRDNTGATGANAIAIGPTAKSTGDNGLAIGNNAQANSNYAVALGHYANNGSINSANSISIGWVAGGSSNGASNVAIGTNAGKQITGNNNISLGNTAGTVTNNNVYTSESILLGTEARVKGSTSSKSVNNVIAIGKGAEGSATSATSIGINANASAENAMALGPSSKATAYNGVALGSFSEANTAGGTAGYNVNTSRTDKYAGLTGLALTANTGAVSIGSSTKTRQITNLAAGTNDTDAVNVAQLKSVNLAVKGNSGAGGDVNLATNPLTIKGNDNYITTSASGNTVNISGKVQNISVSNGTAAAAVGMADAKNVAEAINNAVSQNAYTWNLTADNDTAGSRSTITKEGTVKFSGDQNITVKRNGNTITSSLNKSITVDSVKANNSVTTGSGSNQITLDGTTGAVTGKTFSGQSFTAGDNVLSNTTLQIGSPTNGNNVTITKDGLTSKAGTKTAKFGANGIDAGGQQITNVSSGGNVGTNAANITDVKNAVSDVTLNLDTNSKTGTVKLSESPLKVIGANGIRTDLVGTNNGSLVIGLDQATVNATTKGIGLTGDTGSTGNKYLKDGDVSFAVTGDGNLVSTSATTAGVKVAVNAAKVKDLAVEAVTVSKDTQADNPITVTPTAGTNSKDYAIGIDTTKLAGKTDLTYRANNDTDANAQKVSLAKGLNFVNGDNTVATVAADGKVSYDLNGSTKTKIDDSATAVARNISLGADSGTSSSQSLKDGDVAFNVKGATGDYVSTNMNGNTVEVSTTRATIDSNANTGAASVTGNDGLATAKNVADAINKAADAAKAGAAWNLTTNSSTTDKTSVQGGDTVDLINGDNIVITQDGTDKKKITVATKKDLTVDSVTAGNTVINTSGLTNGTTAITGSGITTDKVTVGGISIDKTDGINAGGKAISNVASGGTTDTNAANIGDVKQAVANLSQNLNITDGTNNGTVDLKNQKLNVAGANGVTATVNNQTITVGLDANTVNATTKGIGLTADTGSTGNKYLKDGDVSFAVTGDGNLVSTSATAAGVKVAVDAAKVKDLAVDAVTVSKDAQADNPITVTPTAGTNSKDYAIGIDTTKLAAKTDLTYRANNDTDANAKKVSLAKGLNFVNGTLTTASIDNDGVVKYDVNTAAITAGTDGTVTGPTTDGVATAQNVADAINAAKKAAKTEITANTGEAANATTGNVTLTSTTAADGHTIYDVKLNDKVTLGTGANAVTIDGTTGKITAKNAAIGGVTLDGDNSHVTGLSNTTWNGTATTGRAATEDQLKAVADTAKATTDAVNLKFSGDTNTSAGVVNLKDDTFNIVGDGKYVTTDANGKDLTVKVSEAEVKKSAVAAVTVSTDTTDANNPISVTPTTSADGTTKDYKVTIDGTKIANKTNLSYKANDSTAKQVSLADGLNFKNGTLTTASIDDAGVVKYDVNTATITAGTDGTVTGPTTDGVATAQNVADAINAAKKAAKTEITANTGEAANATTGNVTLTSTTATDGHTIYDVKLNDKVTLGTGANAVTIDGTAGTVTGLTNKDWTPGVTKAVTGRAATEDQLQKVADAASSQTWNITADKAGTTGAQTGTKKNATVGKDQTVELVAGDNLTINQDERKFTYSLNKDLAGLTSVSVGDGTTETIKLDGATGKVTAKNAVIGGVTVDGDNSHVTGLSNTTWNGTATTGRAATEDQLKAVSDTAKATTDAVNLKFSGDTNTSAGVVNLKDDTFNIVGDGKYVTTDANGKDLTVKVSEAEVKKSAVSAVTVSTDTTDANNPISVTPTTSADGTTKDYKVTIDGTKIANKTNLSYKANDGTAKQVSLADGLNFKNGTLTTASIDDAGVVKYDVNTATITAGTDGTVTGPTTDGVATAQNVADAINAAKKAAKTEITANTGEVANATTGNMTLTSTTAADGHTIYDVKLNDKVTLGTGANAVTIDGTAGKATVGTAVVDGVNNTITTGGANAVSLDGAAGKATIGSSVVDGVNNTITTGGANAVSLDGAAGTVTGLTNKDWTPGVTKAVTGRAATEDQLQKVADAASSQTWNITADKAGTTGAQTGTKKNATVGKDQTVELVAGDNLTINQDERKFTYSLNKDLAGLTSVSVGDGTTETINLDGATGKITAKNAVIGGVTVDGDNSHVTGLSNTTWNGTATTGRAATEDQLKAVADTAKATTDAVNLKFSGDTNTSAGVVNLKDDTFNIVGDGKYVTTDANGKDLTVKVSEAEVKKSAVAAVTVSTDTTDANNPISVTPTTSADGTTKDYKVTIDGTKIANKTNLSYKANDGTAKQVSLADGLNFKNGTLTTASIDDAGIVKYDVNTAAITAGTDGTVTGPTTDGVATAQNVADAINAAKKAAKTEITANTGEAANATTGNVTLTSTTAADGHTIYDVKLNDKVTLGTGANAVTIDGTAGKATVGTAVVDGVNNTITTGGANAVALDGAAGTVKTGTVTVTGGTTNDITGLSNTTVTAADFATKGRAATEEQLKAVGEQTWKITADKDATTSGAQTGTKKDAKVGKDDKVQLIAGENLTVNQNERDFTYSLNKDLVKMNSATFEATGGKTTVITGDSIAQTDGTKTNTSTAAGNTVADGGKSTATTADGTTVTNGADSTATTAAGTTVTSANGNTNYAADGVRINTTGKNPVSLTDAGLDNGNNVIKNVASGHVNNDDTDNTNAANIADVKKATTTVTANNGEAANATTGNVTLTSTTAADGHTIYDVKLNDKVTLGTGANAVTIDGTAGKATIGSSVVDGVNNTITTGGANAVALDGAAGTVKTGTVTVSGGTTNDITGLSNTTVNAADFATKGRAATEEQLKQVGEQTWQITADKDATTSGNQTGTKKDAKVGKDDKVQLIAGENLTVNQNERDFTYSLNKDLVKMNSATFEATGGKTTVITGDSIAQTDGTKTNRSTAAGNTVADGTKSTETTAAGQVIKDGAKTNTSTVDENTLVDGAKSNKTTVDSNVIDDGNGNVNTSNATSNTITDGTNTSTITAGKATIGSSIIDGVNNTITTGAANAVKLDGAAGTVKTGTVTLTGGTTNDITGLSNTTVNSADFATKGRAATEEQLKAVGEQTWQITADKDATTSGNQTGTKKDAKVGKDDKVQLIAGENLTVNQNERDFTYSLNKDLVKMNSATFEATGGKTTVITGDSIAQTDGTKTNTSTAAGNTVADGTKSTETTAAGQVIKDGTKTNTSTVDENTLVDGAKSNKTTVDSNEIDDGNGNVNTSNATSNTITDGTNTSTITAGKATIGSSIIDGVNNTFTTGGANAVKLDGAAGTVKTGTVTVSGGTTNDITGLSNTTVTAADFATKGRAATEEQLKAVGEQTWQITADKDATTSGNQTGTKKDAKVGKDDKVQLIAGENLTVNQNERDFTYSLNKDLVKMNSATFEATGGKTTVITGDSIAQTDGIKTNTSTAAGNTVVDGGKSTATTADGTTVTNGANSTATTAAGTTVTSANGNTNYAADGVRINTTGKNPVSLTDAGLDNGNNVIKNVASGHVNNDDTDNTNAANIADVKKATTTVTANNGEAANATTGNVTLTSTTAADGHTIYDVKLNDKVTLGTGANAVTIDGTAGKATIGSSVVDGVNNTITTGGANAVALDGAAGTVKTGTVTVTGGTTNDITGLSNTTVTAADFATKGRAATEEQLKAVGEQTWQITADKDATTSGNQTGTKKDAKVGKDDKVQLIAGENLTVNQNERDFTYSLNKDLVKMNSATFEATGGKTTVITGDSIAQTDGTKTNTSTAAGNTVADGTKSTETTAAGQVIKDGAKTNTSTVDENTLVDGAKSNKTTVDSNVIDDGNGNVNTSNATSNTIANGADSTATTAAGTTVTNANGNTNYAADGVRINTTGKNPVSLTDAGLDNGNNVIKNVASGHVNNDDTDNTNAANIADVKKATTTVTANNGETANSTTGNVTLTSTTAADGHTIYDVKLKDTVTLGTGANAVTIDGTAGKATIGSSVVDGVNNTITTGGANAVALDGTAGTVKTGTVTVSGGTTNDITGLSNTTVNAADFATKGRAATEEQLKQVGEQTWQITADKDATTSGNQTGTKKDAKVGKDDKVQLIAGENLTVNQNERDFTYSLNKDLVKMNSATFEATGGKTTVITGDSIAQTDGTKTNRSTAAGNTIADGTKSTETTAAGQVIKDGAKTNTSTVDENTLVDGAKSNKTTVDSNVIDDGNGNVNTSNATSNTITDGTNTTEATASTVTVKDNAGNSTVITKDTITTGTGANKVTVDGTAGKVTAGSAVIDGVNNTITTGGANTVKLDGAAGTVTGLTNTAWTPGVTKAVSGRAATEDQLQQVSDAVGAGWNINSGTVAGSTGEANGSAKTKISSGEEVQLQAGNNLIIDQNGKTLAYSLNKNLKDMESAIFNAAGGKTTVIKGDSIVQTDGGKTNTSNAAGNTVVDGTKSTATTAVGTTITDGAKTNTNTADKNVIDDGAGNTNTSNATSNTIADPNGNTNTATATNNTLADNAGNSNVSNATSNNLTDNAGNSNVSNATSNTLKNAAGDETKVDAKGATVKDAAGNTTNVASTGATVTNAAGDTTKVEATGTTVADAAGNKATFTKDGVTITKPGKDTVSLTGNGLDNGNNKIVNVADGTNDTDAVNVRQLDAKTKAATTELTANGGESANNTTGNIVLTKTTAPDGHIIYDNKLNDKITLGAADPTKAITVDGTNGTIKAGKDGNAVAINGTDGTIKAGDGTNAVAIDGVNGSVKVADKIALNGKDGKAAIGTVGIDGKDGIITTGGNNPVAVNGKDGVVTGLTNKTWDPNNITSGRAATEDQVQSAVANAGWDATVGTEGSGVNSTPNATPEKIRPNETLTFKAGNNMMVSQKGKTISYAVNPELTDMKSATFKDAAGNTTVTNGNGMTITPGSANPNNPNAGPVSLTKDGLNNGNNQIKGVAPGSDDTDAVNIGQLKASNAKIGDAIGQVAGEVQRVGAHAAAMAALKPIQYDPLEPTQVMAGVGNYRGETAAALGLAHYTNENTMFNVGVSVGGNHNMVNAGVTHKFGSSPEKKNIPDRYKAGPISSVYVMQDEVSSLKKENAEQKYVIADQAARLNTLEAENERQRQELAETKQGLDDLRAAVDRLLASKG
ncbi:ESPR-type extended signal peptide-containing protein [Veillonella rogosae]